MKLSNQSRKYIVERRRSDQELKNDSSQSLNQARLFCELYEIISIATDELNKMTRGHWSVCYQGEDQQTLAFHFRLHQSVEDFYPNITIQIEPAGISYIRVQTDPSKNVLSSLDSEIAQFFNSPAYRRYFAPHSNSLSDLVTTIPSRQIISRDFGSYLVHLFEMMGPYIKLISRRPTEARVAA